MINDAHFAALFRNQYNSQTPALIRLEYLDFKRNDNF